MRAIFFTWLLLVSCTQAISSSGLHRNFSSEQRGLNPSKSNNQTQQPFENHGSIKEASRLHIKDEESNNEGKYELSYGSIKKGHGGKGAAGGGGANVDHRPGHSASSATSVLSWISTMYVSLTLIMVFAFHVKVL